MAIDNPSYMVSRDPDGGSRSARGLRYQYQRTVKELLDLLDQGAEGYVVHVEGGPREPDGVASEVVDYAVVDGQERLRKVVQVKSVSDARDRKRAMSAPAALRIALRLIGRDAGSYELITNGSLSAQAAGIAAALASPSGSPRDLVARLVLVARGDVRNRLLALREGDLERLQRVRIISDPRTPAELRAELEERLRSLRRSRDAEVSASGARILLGYLVELVFGTAAERTERTITLEDFRRNVLSDSQALAVSAGEFGGVPSGDTPWLPEVERPQEMARLMDRLPPAAPKGKVRACAILGASGLGKTSLAALYAFEHRHDYDFILWLDAETDDTLRASVERVFRNAPFSSGDARLTAAEVSDEGKLRRLLAQYPGRWLVVFDGAVDPTLVRDWRPTQGYGDVLVTSTNSAAWTQYGRVDLNPMSLSEATALLAMRLGVGNPASENAQKNLESLAEVLECWPLALELAAAYISASGWSADDIPRYLTRLATRPLDDRASIPEFYRPNAPLTLVGAINLCLDRIETGDPGDSRLAVGVILTAAFTASRRIPMALLLECAVVASDPDIVPDWDPGSMPPFSFPEDVSRSLRSESLVTVDRPETIDVLGPTISVNEIVQEVVRRRADGAGSSESTLVTLGGQASRWLERFRPDRAHAEIAELFQHVSALLAHLEARRLSTGPIAVLFGNFANVQKLRGLPAEAVRLLTLELTYVRETAPDTALEVKIHVGLAQGRLSLGGSPGRILEDVEAALDVMSTFDDPIETFADEIRALAQVTRGVVRPGPAGARHAHAQRVLAELASYIETSPVEEAFDEINRLIMEDRDREAADLAAEVLEQADLSFADEVTARGLLGEACAWSGDWRRASEAAHDLQARVAGAGDLAAIGLHSYLELALASAVPASMLRGDAMRLFEAAVAMARPVIESGLGSPSDRARYYALELLRSCVAGDAAAAEEALGRFVPDDLIHSDIQEPVAYLDMVDAGRAWLARR